MNAKGGSRLYTGRRSIADCIPQKWGVPQSADRCSPAAYFTKNAIINMGRRIVNGGSVAQKACRHARLPALLLRQPVYQKMGKTLLAEGSIAEIAKFPAPWPSEVWPFRLLPTRIWVLQK